MILKIKRHHPDAVLPVKAHATDAGMDLTAINDGAISKDGQYIEYDTGISVEPPLGYHTLIHPRSSISNFDLILANSIGLVDNGYRNTLKCRFKIIPPVTLERIDTGGRILLNARTAGVHSWSEREYPCWAPKLYKKGDRIAQLVIEQTIDSTVVEEVELTDTQRGEKGFGSTGS
jgi:dUTP pyrophosphatase